MVSYKKLRDGNWGVFGPIAEIRVGQIKVKTKSGKVKVETVTGFTKPFDVNGTLFVIGFIEQRNKFYSRGDGGPRGSQACYMCGSYYCEGARGGLCEND